MNIQEAKEEIKHTLCSYLARDESGEYLYPVKQQRPLLLMGPPGIGKTAVIEQAAEECGVGLVSYTMTHHTRQSAVGLPRLVEKTYGGWKSTVTEYTMSEIIASVYDCMEQTGCREGILFIDEINCVSETLSPVMLQFLQNKRFGMHTVPEGWMIVAAGNPPEYNRSAKELDLVTLDRVRRMDIEADLQVWQSYASERNVHAAIRSFLLLYPDRFYLASSGAVQKTFVTARGWEDLSALIGSYERLGIPVGPAQIGEFLGDKKTAAEFASYYKIWTTYGGDYHVQELLGGKTDPGTKEQLRQMAGNASFEERYTLIRQMQDCVIRTCRETGEARDLAKSLLDWEGKIPDQDLSEWLAGAIAERKKTLETRQKNGLVKEKQAALENKSLKILEAARQQMLLDHITDKSAQKEYLLRRFREQEEQADGAALSAKQQMDRAFSFCEEAFGTEQEMMILVSGLARDADSMRQITDFGCSAFLRWSENLV